MHGTYNSRLMLDLEVVRGEEGLHVVAGVVVPAPLLLLRDHAGGPPLPWRGGAVPAASAPTGRLPVGSVGRPAPGRRRVAVDDLPAVRLAAAPLLQRETHMPAARVTTSTALPADRRRWDR
jgi:hypothetical protein